MKPMIVIYYHPECEFCNSELSELLKHKKEMKFIQLLFVTFASVEEIKNHMKLYPIDQFENVTIVSDINGEFAYAFDIESPPMIFIYDRNKVLIKKHKGVMPFERLESFLHKLY